MSVVASAVAKNAKISPQKVRLVADQIRGLTVEKAVEKLQFSDKKAAVIMKKVLESAVANAEHNDSLDVDGLMVSEVFVDAGLVMKRIMPRAKGRADRVLKRSSHITVRVSPAE